jgi:hypothetical protein
MASALLSPAMVQYAAAGLYSQLLQVAVMVFVMVPIVILALWGIGKLLGVVFNRPEAVAV